MINLLFVGDVVGEPGRTVLKNHLSAVIEERRIDFVIVNVENSAGGFGVTPAIGKELLDSGVHCLTSGNHIWARREGVEWLRGEERCLRPLNYPDAPGNGVYVGVTRDRTRVGVVNVQGRVFMDSIDCPFRAVDEALSKIRPDCDVILVDVHAEATSEKMSLGWYLDGRVTAVVGTHTHVPTADERILHEGTAFISDVGMTGCYDSVIGMDKDVALRRFLSNRPNPYKPASGSATLSAVIIGADPKSGRATTIERLSLNGARS